MTLGMPFRALRCHVTNEHARAMATLHELFKSMALHAFRRVDVSPPNFPQFRKYHYSALAAQVWALPRSHRVPAYFCRLHAQTLRPGASTTAVKPGLALPANARVHAAPQDITLAACGDSGGPITTGPAGMNTMTTTTLATKSTPPRGSVVDTDPRSWSWHEVQHATHGRV